MHPHEYARRGRSRLYNTSLSRIFKQNFTDNKKGVRSCILSCAPILSEALGCTTPEMQKEGGADSRIHLWSFWIELQEVIKEMYLASLFEQSEFEALSLLLTTRSSPKAEASVWKSSFLPLTHGAAYATPSTIHTVSYTNGNTPRHLQ